MPRKKITPEDKKTKVGAILIFTMILVVAFGTVIFILTRKPKITYEYYINNTKSNIAGLNITNYECNNGTTLNIDKTIFKVRINGNVEDKTKPIFYLYDDYIINYNFKLEELEMGQGETIIYWSGYAFNEHGTEMTKFINSLGYSFNEKQITDNEIYEAAKRYKELDDRTKQQNIIETDEYIYVKI